MELRKKMLEDFFIKYAEFVGHLFPFEVKATRDDDLDERTPGIVTTAKQLETVGELNVELQRDCKLATFVLAYSLEPLIQRLNISGVRVGLLDIINLTPNSHTSSIDVTGSPHPRVLLTYEFSQSQEVAYPLDEAGTEVKTEQLPITQEVYHSLGFSYAKKEKNNLCSRITSLKKTFFTCTNGYKLLPRFTH